MATKLCNEEKVVVNGDVCKASKTIAPKDEISVKHNPIWKEFAVLDLPKSRVSAKQVPEYLIEITNPDILKQYEAIQKANRVNKMLGIKGRPTKKDRRNINKFRGAS